MAAERIGHFSSRRPAPNAGRRYESFRLTPGRLRGGWTINKRGNLEEKHLGHGLEGYAPRYENFVLVLSAEDL